MANDIEPLLLRAHIAAAQSKKSSSDIANAQESLALGNTGDANFTANALAEALGDPLSHISSSNKFRSAPEDA